MHVDVYVILPAEPGRCSALKPERRRTPIHDAGRGDVRDVVDLGLRARAREAVDQIGVKGGPSFCEVGGSAFSPAHEGALVDACGLGGDVPCDAAFDYFHEAVHEGFVELGWCPDPALAAAVGAAVLASGCGFVAAGCAGLRGFAAGGAVG